MFERLSLRGWVGRFPEERFDKLRGRSNQAANLERAYRYSSVGH